ncbi:unnamed protein product [Brachionus calyciflorus]|uniref:Uncharacterized protein n=1 Tax=Brachionus calyciflorus TaxID=104777 RepID=A0A813Z3V1_9BILA|nr:unnamed protein product [Brachionus calyciflorus]
MLPMSSFNISDSTYNDFIQTHPFHYNSMRAKPIYPIGLIETNISSVRPFPEKWSQSKSGEFPRINRHFAKRTLFNANDIDTNIHMATLSVLSTQHLMDPKIQYPQEDDFHRFVGRKRVVSNKRNDITERKPGDKTYRTPEYSKSFHLKTTRNWRSEIYELPKKNEEALNEELIQMLKLNPNIDLFPTKFDFGYEHDAKLDKQQDIVDVKHLNSWKTSPKLEVPFKVLDLPEKALKYRPRVTR